MRGIRDFLAALFVGSKRPTYLFSGKEAVSEVSDSSTIGSAEEMVETLFNQQVAEVREDDESETAPLPKLNSLIDDYAVFDSTFMYVELRNTIAAQIESTIYEADLVPADIYNTARVVERTDVVAKYAVNCYEIDEVAHPTVRDYIFQSRAYALGAAPEILYLSPPSRYDLRFSQSRKFNFTMPPSVRTRCTQDTRAEVRLLVMGNAGLSVHDWFNDYLSLHGVAPPLVTVLEVLVRLLSRLQLLHENDIVHNDIHAGNVMLRKDEGLLLIDFEKAMFVSDLESFPSKISGEKSHFLYSPYTMKGSRVAPRDDVFNAVWMAAYLVNGPNFAAKAQRLTEKNLYRMKKKTNFFEFVTPPYVPSVSRRDMKIIRSHLSRVVELVQTMDDLRTPPPYLQLQSLLVRAVMLVNPKLAETMKNLITRANM